MKKIKEFFKKFGKYFIMVFLLLLGLSAVGVLYLFFVPNSSLFGISYISKNSNHNSEVFSAEKFNKVSLTSNNYKVNVISTDSKNIEVKVLNNSFGFVKKENVDIKIESKIIDETLSFTIQEPTGLAIANNSFIQLSLPKEKSLDLDLTNNSAETTIASEGLQIDNLKYTTSNGNAFLNNVQITGDVFLDLGNSTFTTGETLSLPNINTSDFYINLTTGKFNASAAVLGDVTVQTNTRGIIDIKECNRFYEEVEIAGGSIHIAKLFEAVVKTSDTNISFDEVKNSVVIVLTKSGNVSIGTLNGISDIKTATGTVSITKVNSSQLILQTENGNINVAQAYNHIEALTNHGTINITWAEDAPHHNVETAAGVRSLSANIDGNGKVVANNVEHVFVMIKGRGRAELTMSAISGQNTILGDSGSVFVHVDKNAKYSLKTTSESGSVRVNLTQVPNFQGYTDLDHPTVYVNSDEQNYAIPENLQGDNKQAERDAYIRKLNGLNITTKTGNITVLDSNF